MSHVLKISEAASLAMHTMVWLASNPGHQSTRKISQILNVSQNHLSKVMQRLVKAGLVESKRGPVGGFTLAVPAEEITLLEVYEIIEGPLKIHNCLFDQRICNSKDCILGELLGSISEQLREYLAKKRLNEFHNTINWGQRNETKDHQNRRIVV